MLVYLLLSLSGLLGRAQAGPNVHINGTTVNGKSIGSSLDVEFFGGIPFAEPPLGSLRFEFPVLRTFGNTPTINAMNFGPGCLQIPSPPSGVSEDCLTLDVYRPAGTAADSKLPVMAWIYGGGYAVGASSFYDATAIIERSVQRGTPIMFVSMNYRLGPIGFPQGIEASQNGKLNLGLHDQMAALQWIQQNIGRFGGDAKKVTVAGESVGGTSIATFFLQSKIKGLARAAIMQSTGRVPIQEAVSNDCAWLQFVANVPACASAVIAAQGSSTCTEAAVPGTSTFECLKQADSTTLLQAVNSTGILDFQNTLFAPVVDGPGGIMPARPSKIAPKGLLPTLMGTNLDEGTLFTPQFASNEQFIEFVLTSLISPPIVSADVLNQSFTTAFELYPDIPALGSPFRTGNDTFGLLSGYKQMAAMLGDILTHSSRRTLGEQLSNAGVPAFVYHFVERDSAPFQEFSSTAAMDAPGSLGVAHTSDIPFVFGTLVNRTQRAVTLSNLMQDYWISFVHSLTPNDNNGETERPKWTPFTNDNPVIMRLHGKNSKLIQDKYRKEQISFWQSIPDVLLR